MTTFERLAVLGILPAPRCSEKGCVFPAIKHGICLHHLRIYGGPHVQRLADADPEHCDCGLPAGHRGGCRGVSKRRAKSKSCE